MFSKLMQWKGFCLEILKNLRVFKLIFFSTKNFLRFTQCFENTKNTINLRKENNNYLVITWRRKRRRRFFFVNPVVFFNLSIKF